jgi:hypothetical protein
MLDPRQAPEALRGQEPQQQQTQQQQFETKTVAAAAASWNSLAFRQYSSTYARQHML